MNDPYYERLSEDIKASNNNQTRYTAVIPFAIGDVVRPRLKDKLSSRLIIGMVVGVQITAEGPQVLVSTKLTPRYRMHIVSVDSLVHASPEDALKYKQHCESAGKPRPIFVPEDTFESEPSPLPTQTRPKEDKMQTFKLEDRVYLNDRNVATMSTEELLTTIVQIESEIIGLKKIQTESVVVAARIESLQTIADRLAKFADARPE